MADLTHDSHLRLVVDRRPADQPEVTELESFNSSWDETNLVTFPVCARVGGPMLVLTLTTQRLTLGPEAVHLVNITGLACSGVVHRQDLGPLPRRYLIRVIEAGVERDFSFCDTPLDRYVIRAGYEALMQHLQQGVLPMIHSDLERRVEGGERVQVGPLEVTREGFGVAGQRTPYPFADYSGCLMQDHLILVQAADPVPRVVAKVALTAMNARVLPDLLDDLAGVRPEHPGSARLGLSSVPLKLR